MILVDLETIQPVGQIAIRLLAGKEQGSLTTPNGIEFLASRDGKSYHLLQSMRKLMPAERDLSDMKTAFYLPEEGRAFVHAFVCREPVRARYLAIRLYREASVFSDEISVLKAGPEVEVKEVSDYPVAPALYTEGLVIRPRQPVMTITEGVLTPNWILFENLSPEEGQSLSVEMTLPDAIRLVGYSSKNEPSEEREDRDQGTRTYRFEKLQELAEARFHLFLEKEAGKTLPANPRVRLVSEINGEVSHRLEYPLEVRAMPEGPYSSSLDVSLAWMWVGQQRAWPGFHEGFRKLGFNYVSCLPRYWQNRTLERSWIEERRQREMAWLEESRKAGYKVIMNDSPFHEMAHTFENAHSRGLVSPEEEAEFRLQNAAGAQIPQMNPLYRGEFYRRELERVKQLVAEVKPDHLYLDIERWWRSARLAKDDPRVVRVWKESGKPWEEYITDVGAEMLRDLAAVAREAMDGAPPPVIGLYGAHAAQKAPTDGLFEWKKIFPHSVQLSMPSLYVQGRTPDVVRRIRDDYALIGKPIIPWLTAATYGPVNPPAMETMVLETILNGGRGVTYYEYRDFDPLHFYYHAQALAKLGRFPRLLKEGKPRPYAIRHDQLNATCFASEGEALLLVSNYARSPESSVTLTPPLKKGNLWRVENGERVPVAVSEEGGWREEIAPGQSVLFYQQREE